MKTILDPFGIRHRVENGNLRNTRCGKFVVGPKSLLRDLDDVDCMTCLGGPSLLSMLDLRSGFDVVAWIHLVDNKGNRACESIEITFTQGISNTEIKWTNFVSGTIIVGYRYHDEDDRTLQITLFNETYRVNSDDYITIEKGKARVT